jgi:hypothetical protein
MSRDVNVIQVSELRLHRIDHADGGMYAFFLKVRDFVHSRQELLEPGKGVPL